MSRCYDPRLARASSRASMLWKRCSGLPSGDHLVSHPAGGNCGALRIRCHVPCAHRSTASRSQQQLAAQKPSLQLQACQESRCARAGAPRQERHPNAPCLVVFKHVYDQNLRPGVGSTIFKGTPRTVAQAIPGSKATPDNRSVSRRRVRRTVQATESRRQHSTAFSTTESTAHRG